MFKQKYIITVESESPPRICLGDSVYGATVIALEKEQYPDLGKRPLNPIPIFNSI